MKDKDTIYKPGGWYEEKKKGEGLHGK